MKNIKKSTWISVLCVFGAVLASQIYSSVQNAEPKKEELAVVSEIKPTQTPIPLKIPAPLAVPENTPKAALVPAATPAPEPEVSTVSAPISFLLPSSGDVSLPYSDKALTHFPILGEWRCHLGIDFIPSDSDKVLAVADGTVEKIFEDHLYGSTVCIDHGQGLKSYYASLAASTVEEGKAVSAGTEIGRMGETASIEEGVHLHFYMEKDGKPIDPFGQK